MAIKVVINPNTLRPGVKFVPVDSTSQVRPATYIGSEYVRQASTHYNLATIWHKIIFTCTDVGMAHPVVLA